MEHNAFASLAVLRFSFPCRLLPSACCPDKDLVVLVSRLGGRDRLTLWKMQGTKKWDVEVECDENTIENVSALAWSPCGMVYPSQLRRIISNLDYPRSDDRCGSWLLPHHTSFSARWTYRAFSYYSNVIT